ncbi:MAG: hypothetical protein JNL02_06180 [Saprospiraceae bacterium]|nr:hypothetical protein [Saprospiraceae bacterium]
MKTGQLINFYVPFIENNKNVSPDDQAILFLDKATDLIRAGAPGVGFTYSANYGQTRTIQQTYFSGGWNTQTNGANQAKVVESLEALLDSKYPALQGKLHILPITTMNAYVQIVAPWNDDVHLGIVTTDLDRIENYLKSGWTVLGWQNQISVNNPKHPYAVGGGVAQGMPTAVSDKIQQTLISLSTTYK